MREWRARNQRLIKASDANAASWWHWDSQSMAGTEMSMSDPRGIRNRPRKPWRRVDSRLARAGTRCAILIEICRVWRPICICTRQESEHGRSTSIVVGIGRIAGHCYPHLVSRGAHAPANGPRDGQNGDSGVDGGEPIVSGWTVVCVPHAGIMHGPLGSPGQGHAL